MDIKSYTDYELDAMLGHVCELIKLVQGNRSFEEAVNDKGEFCKLLGMQAKIFAEIRRRNKITNL